MTVLKKIKQKQLKMSNQTFNNKKRIKKALYMFNLTFAKLSPEDGKINKAKKDKKDWEREKEIKG